MELRAWVFLELTRSQDQGDRAKSDVRDLPKTGRRVENQLVPFCTAASAAIKVVNICAACFTRVMFGV